MTFRYPVVITPKTDGRFAAFLPDLEGCAAEGRDLEDALDAVRADAAEWIRIEMSEFEGDIPFASDPEDLVLEGEQFLRMILVNVKLLPDND